MAESRTQAITGQDVPNAAHASVPAAFPDPSRPLRRPGLDWVRATAALAVVALHAGIPYMSHPLPALEWSVRSPDRSPLVDALCWAINGAVMPTFFVMGGSLAAGLWHRNPGSPFLAHRSRRLLLPLVFAIVFVLPADMYVWLIGWYTQGLIPWKKVLSIKLAEPLSSQFWGVAHLWYLECLWTLSLLAAAVVMIRNHWPLVGPAPPAGVTITPQFPHRALPRSIFQATRSLLAITAAGLILACDPTFLIGFQQSWWPGPAAIAYYAIFFAAGWTWKTVDHSPPLATTPRQSLPNRASRKLLAAAVLFPGLLSAIHLHVTEPFHGLPLLALTTAFAAYGWLIATAAFQWGHSPSISRMPSAIAFVAEASFWMYLVHHPLAGLTQLALLNAPWPPLAKFLLSFAIPVALSLASYALFVRGGILGRLLNGQGQSQSAATPAPLRPRPSPPAERPEPFTRPRPTTPSQTHTPAHAVRSESGAPENHGASAPAPGPTSFLRARPPACLPAGHTPSRPPPAPAEENHHGMPAGMCAHSTSTRDTPAPSPTQATSGSPSETPKTPAREAAD